MRRAKILITLGPASREPEIVEQLIAAGANGVRINMSHGTHEEKTLDIERARAAAANTTGQSWQRGQERQQRDVEGMTRAERSTSRRAP